MSKDWKLMTDPPERDGVYDVCYAHREHPRDYWDWKCVRFTYKNDAWWWPFVDEDDNEVEYEDDNYNKILAWKRQTIPTPPEFALEELQEMNRRVVI